MLTYLQRLADERESLSATATHITEAAATDNRDLTDVERASLATMATRCAEIDGQLETLGAQADSTRAYAALRTRLAELETPSAPAPVVTRQAEIVTPSWSEVCERAGVWSDYRGHGTSERVELGSALETRAPIMTTDNVYPPAIVRPPAQPTFPATLTSLVGVLPVSSGSVSYIVATPVPPADAPVVAEGALKPEMPFVLVETTKSLETYAHYKAITRQALEDIPQIRALVEQWLRRGIVGAIESAIATAITGDATIPSATDPASLLNAIRVAIGTVQGNGYTPNGVALNPADWAAIDIGVMGGTLGGPSVNSASWGLSIVGTPKIPAGTAFVGDFQEGVTYFDRGQTSVYLSDSHSDFFLRNQLVLLGETRGHAAVVAPLALCTATVVTVP